jgi:hypothetical protein
MTDPISALFAAIPGIAKAGADIAAASDEAKRNAQLIEFQRVIIQLQSSIASVQVQNASLLQDKTLLEQEIVRFKNWEGESSRYQLHTIEKGIVTYALKKSMANSEPPHWLCPACYGKNQKSLLNRIGKTNASDHHYKCSCGYEVVVFNRISPEYVF